MVRFIRFPFCFVLFQCKEVKARKEQRKRGNETRTPFVSFILLNSCIRSSSLQFNKTKGQKIENREPANEKEEVK